MINVKYKKGGLKPLFFLVFLTFLSLFSFIGAVEFSQSYFSEIAKKYGDYARRRVEAWQKLFTENKKLPERQKLEVVNNFFNLLRYEKDIHHWGIEDYWATPLEFVISGAGDCEDFSVGKYFTLLELGVPDERLLLMYVKLKEYSTEFNQSHMVLLYYESPQSIPLVLDNINKEILPADQRTDLKPIYGFNGSGLWQAKELGKGNKIGQASDLKRWSDLEERKKSGKISKWKDEE